MNETEKLATGWTTFRRSDPMFCEFHPTERLEQAYRFNTGYFRCTPCARARGAFAAGPLKSSKERPPRVGDEFTRNDAGGRWTVVKIEESGDYPIRAIDEYRRERGFLRATWNAGELTILSEGPAPSIEPVTGEPFYLDDQMPEGAVLQYLKADGLFASIKPGFGKWSMSPKPSEVNGCFRKTENYRVLLPSNVARPVVFEERPATACKAPGWRGELYVSHRGPTIGSEGMAGITRVGGGNTPDPRQCDYEQSCYCSDACADRGAACRDRAANPAGLRACESWCRVLTGGHDGPCLRETPNPWLPIAEVLRAAWAEAQARTTEPVAPTPCGWTCSTVDRSVHGPSCPNALMVPVRAGIEAMRRADEARRTIVGKYGVMPGPGYMAWAALQHGLPSDAPPRPKPRVRDIYLPENSDAGCDPDWVAS